MSIIPSFRKWFRRQNQAPIQTRIKNLHKKHQARLQLQQLEERCTPANYTVSSLADMGAGTLRQAILDANTVTPGVADTIDFTVSGLIALASDLPAINDAAGLSIDATAGTIELNGSGFGGVRGLQVDSGSFSLNNFNIHDFLDGIDFLVSSAAHNLTLTNVSSHDNDFDGLDANGPAGSINVSASSFNNNGDNGLEINDVSSVNLTGVDANGNGSDGVNVTATGPVTLSGVTANGNTGDGLDISSSATINVTGAVTSNDNVKLAAGDDVVLNAAVSTSGSAVDIDANDDVVFGVSGSITATGSAGVSVTADADSAGGGAIGTSVTEGALIDAGSGPIVLSATDDVFLNQLVTTVGVTVASTSLRILSLDAGNNITAASAILNAGSAVGSAVGFGSLQTMIGKLEASAGVSGVWIANTGNLEIGGISAQVGVTGGIFNHPISITAAGSITVSETIDSNGGTVGLGATTDVIINAAILSDAGAVDIDANNDVVFGVSGSITATGSAGVSVTADADSVGGGAIGTSITEGALINAGTGPIVLSATDDVFLNQLVTTVGVTVTSTSLRILSLDAGNNITAASALLKAAVNVGSAVGFGPLQTAVTNLDVSNSSGGGIFITNTGALTLTDLDGDTFAVNGVGGGGAITAASPLTISADAITTGGMTYTAGDSASNDVDHLTVTGAGTVVRENTALTLNAGDDLNIEVDTTVEVIGVAATLTLNIDALGGGVADALGSTANLNGTIATDGTTIQLNGGGQDDMFVIDSNGVPVNNGGTVNNVQNNISINAGGGGDTLFLDDSGDATADTVNISNDGSGDGTVSGLTTANIEFNSVAIVNVLFSNLAPAADGDTVTVTPNAATTFGLTGNGPTAFPGDHLIYNGSGTKTITGINTGSITAPGVQAVNFGGFERVSATGGLLNDSIDLTLFGGGQDGNPNSVRLERFNDGVAEYLRIFIDFGAGAGEQLFSTQLYSSVNTITVTGATDADRLIVDHAASGAGTTAANSFINRTINFNGGGPVNAGEPNGDALSITGDPGFVSARSTYFVGGTEDAGTWVIDPDGSGGAGSATPGADGMTVNFTGLEPADDDTPAAIFEVIMNAAGNNATIQNGGLLNGFPSLQVVDNNSTFETFRFTRKDVARIMGQSGADTFTLTYSIAPAGADGVTPMGTLEAYGHVAPGVVGQPADDAAGDLFVLGIFGNPNITAAGVTTNLFGQNGNDGFENINVPVFGSFNLDPIQGPLNVAGGLGSDTLALSSRLGASGIFTVTSSTIQAPASALITYNTTESVFLEGTFGADTFDILSSAAIASYLLVGDGDSDTFTIGNQTADFGVVFDGSLDNIAGPINIASDAFNAAPGTDTVNVDDSGTAALAGAASISNVGPQSLSFFGFTVTGDATRLSNFAPAAIDYFHGATGGSLQFGTADNRLEFLNVLASQGNDTIAVNATTATNTTTLDAREGNDTVTINGDALSANNLFLGNTGNDQHVLNISDSIGSTAVYGVLSVQIEGNDPAADSDNRDGLDINDSNAGFARDLNWDYLDSAGDLDILANTAGLGLAGGNNAGMPVNVRTMETVIFNSTGENDTVRVTGTSVDDDITVGLLADDSSALVFLGGNPYTAGPPDSLDGFFPGLAGGGNGPDLLLEGINPFTGLLLDGAGTNLNGNRAIVQAASENDLNTGSSLDYFDFGAGVLIPGFGAGNAWDDIFVNDFFSPDGVAVFNTAFGALVPVTVVPASFVNISPTPPRPGLIVNAGDEAGTRDGVIADDISVTPHTLFNIQVNGNLPPLAFDIDGLPIGDQLNLFSATSFSIWSDKATPPNVSIVAGNNPFGVTYSSIERVLLSPGNGVINLVGDQNNPAIDQNDNFVVVGRDIDSGGGFFFGDAGYQEMTLEINGSTPILLDNVQFLNVFGFDLQGQNLNNPDVNAPDNSTGGATNNIDTLDITAYADNGGGFFGGQPRGWGVHVNFNEGVPVQQDGNQADLLIYNTVAANPVSEDIVAQPSGPEAGELRVTNASDGSLIVTISYVNNLDMIVDDNDGFTSDTDTLTLRGTNPDAPATSGVESVIADFTAAGDVANPMVTVSDLLGGALLYRLRDFTGFDTVNFGLLGGDDFISVIGRDDGSLTVNIDGGNGSDMIITPGTAAGADFWQFTPGSSNDAGNVHVLLSSSVGVTRVNYQGVEDILVDGGGAGGADILVFSGTGGNNAITLTGNSTGAGIVRVDDSARVSFANLGDAGVSLLLTGDGGDDSFAVNPVADWGIDFVNINGGSPSASDSATLTLADTDDTVSYTPISANQANLTVTNGTTTTFSLNGIESLNVDARDLDDDTLNVTTAGTFVNTPGQEAGSGVAVVYLGPGLSNGTLPLNYRHFENVNFTGTTVVVNGTDGDDAITVDRATGAVTVNGNVTNYAGTSAIIINVLGGDDTITVNAGAEFPGGVSIIGGDNGTGSDSVTVNGQTSNDDIVVDLLAGTVDDAISSPVSLTGIEHLTVNGNGTIGGDSISVSGLGSFTGLESITLNGNNNGGDTMSVSGTSGPDNLNFNPTDAASGQVTRTGTATTINYGDLTGTMTVAGGTGGFDVLTELGTEGADTVTTSGDSVSRDGTLTILTIGAGIERFAVLALGGNDSITLSLNIPGLEKSVDGGAGNDTIDLSGTLDADIFGGIGDDTIIGSPVADLIDAGQGNDTINASGGADTVYGGTGSDAYIYTDGAGIDDNITLSAIGSAAVFDNPNAGQLATLTGVESLTINSGDSATGDSTSIHSLAATDLVSVTVTGDGPGVDFNTDTLTVNATDAADNVTISASGQVIGLGPVINIDGFFDEDPDVVIVNLLGGNDTFAADTANSTTFDLIVNGGAGNDDISGFDTLNGDAGNDALTGSTGDDTINGGAGNDVIDGNGGTDSVAGGAGADTILVPGTPGSDSISLALDAGSLVVTVNGNTTTYVAIGGASIELIDVLGFAGDDNLTVDSTNGGIAIPINFDGGANADSLTLTGGTAASDTYTPGPNVGQGTSVIVIGGVTQSVRFTNLEPVIDNVAGPLTVNGNNADNAINFAGDTISVDALETIQIANKTDVTINALAGSDTININNPTGLSGSVTVNGGDPTGSDTLIVNGTTGSDTIDITILSSNSAVMTIGGVTINGATIERLRIDGRQDEDSQNFSFDSINYVGDSFGDNRIVFTPGDTPDAGTITGFDSVGGLPTFLPVEFAHLGVDTSATATQLNIDANGSGGFFIAGTLVIRGTDGNDSVSVSSAGVIGLTTPNAGAHLLIDGTNFAALELDTFAGDDVVSIVGNHPYPAVRGNAGEPSRSDTLNFNGTGGAVTVDLAAQTVQEAGFGAVRFSGVEVLNVNAAGGDITVVGTGGADDVHVTPTGADTATITIAGLNVTVNTNSSGGLTVDAGDGADTVTVNGQSDGDTIAVVRGATTTVQVDGLKAVSLPAANTEALVIAAGLGDDTINVTGSGGPALTVDGGLPTASDTLAITDPTVTVTYGTDPATGVVATSGGDVSFLGIEIIGLTGNAEGALTVNGTNGDDAINQNGNTVTVNNGAVVNFAGYPTVNLNGRNGDDTINVHPTTLAGVTALNVSGGDPSASDTVIVNGSTGSDTFDITILASDAANVVVNGGVAVAVTGAELLRIDGQQNQDSSNFTFDNINYFGDLAGDNRIVFTPGATPDAGAITGFDFFGGLPTHLPVEFSDLGSGGTVNIDSNSVFPNDALVIRGTDGNDSVGVNNAGSVALTTPNAGPHVLITTANFETLVLELFDGDDTVTVAGNHPYTNVEVNAGSPSASDTLNFNGAGGAVTVDLDNQTVQEAGFGAVTFSGVEVLNVSAGGGAITVLGTTDDDSATVTPTGADTATITVAGLNLTINTTNTGDLTLDGVAGSDHLTVNGTQAGETITVTGALVGVAGRKTINYLGTGNLTVNGLAGSDTFLVTPSATTSIFIDGGDPIGVTPGDNITMAGPATLNPGPESDEGSLETDDNQPVSFDHIESITIIGGGGGGAVINGTNGNDAITIIARDSSTHAGADGVQDFTVTINNGPEVLYLDTASITVNALGGDDVITVRTPAPNGEVWDVDVTIDGGTPTASDKVVIETPFGADHAASYTPTGINSGTFELTDLSSSVNLTDVEQLIYNNVNIVDADTLTVATANAVIVPGANVGDGVVNPTDVNGNALLGLTYLHVNSVTVSGTTAVIQGTAESDTITVSDTGVVTITNALGFNNSVDVSAFAILVINALGGDDTINITGSGLFAGGIRVIGGEPGAGSDELNLTGRAATAEDITILSGVNGLANTILGFGASPMTLNGVELINYTGVDGDDDLSLSPDGGAETIRVATINSGRDLVTFNGVPRVSFAGVETFTVSAGSFSAQQVVFVLPFLGGAANYQAGTFQPEDALVIEGGDSGDDFITVTNPAGGNGLAVTNGSITITETIGSRLIIRGLGGNDTVTVDVGVDGLINVPIEFDGGAGRDSLVVTGTLPAGTLDTVAYTPGTAAGAGFLNYNSGAMTIEFDHLEPVVDTTVATTLTVNGTNANNAINYTIGADDANGLVSVDGFETIEFGNKTNLVINGLAGSDTINLNNPSTPTGLTNITVNGGNPTASDTLIVNGTTGSDTVTYSPSSLGGGSVTITGLPAISFSGTEALTYNGQGGDDALTVNTFSIDGTQTLTPGSAVDAGTLTFQNNTFLAFIATTLQFNNLGSGGSLSLTDVDELDNLVYRGTDLDDAFSVNAGGQVNLNSQIVVNTPSIITLTLAGLDGDDTFNVAGNHNLDEIVVQGGNPSASDTLNFNGSGGAVTIDLAARSVTEVNPVSFSGVEVLNVNAGAGDITVNGRATAESLSVTPTGADTTTIVASGLNLTINTDNTGLLTVDALGGDDQITVNGTQGGETITVTDALVMVDALKTVNYLSTENLAVNGLGGSDTFNVTPSAATSIFIDGGDPIGVQPGDTLAVTVPATAGTTTFRAGPESDEGGFSFSAGGIQPISFDHIESISPVDVTAPGGVLQVCGTNADDDITVVGTGPNALTISVNDGPAVAYIGVTAITICALAGDDDIDITPVASWGVAVTVEGGDPTGSDTLLVNAVDGIDDDITVTPTSTGAGSISGIDINVNYTGVEHIVMVGQSDEQDALRTAGTDGDDTNVLTPGPNADEGAITGFRAGAGGFSFADVDYAGFRNFVSILTNIGAGNDTAIVNGTAADDVFTYDDSGLGDGSVDVNGSTQIFSGAATFIFRGLGGNDTFNIDFDPAIGFNNTQVLRVEGGDSDAAGDVLNYTAAASTTIDLGASSIASTGSRLVQFAGVEVLNANAGAGAITVNGRTGPETISVTPTGADTATIVPSGLNLTINTNNAGTLTVDTLGGNDTVAVNGSNAPDAMVVTYGAATTTVAITGLKSVDLATANTEFLQLNTLGGVDAITLNNNATIVTDVNAGGPEAADSMTYNVAASARVTQGEVSTSGLIDQAGSNVSFSGLALLNMTSATAGSTLTVRGTDDNDHIDVGLVGITAFWINDGTVVRYNSAGGTNFSTVVGQGRFGNDFFSITPHAGVAIIVQGNNPTASDTAIVNGTTGTDAVEIRALTRDGAEVQVTGLGLVTLQTMEHLTYSGLGGNDALTVTTPADGQVIQLTPGSLAGEGSIVMRGFVGGGNPLLPMNFTGISANGSLSFADAGGVRVDDLTIVGTAASNAFGVSATGVVTLDTIAAGVNNRTLIPVSTPGVASLELVGLDGDDIFNVVGNHPFGTGIVVDAGNPSASDVLNFTGSGANPVSVNLGAATVTEATFGPVGFVGVEILNVDANNALSVTATAVDDDVTVTVYSATSGKLVDGISLLRLGEPPQFVTPPVVNYTDITGSLLVDLAGGEDTLAVVGNALSQTFNINDDEMPFLIDLPGPTGYGPVLVPANTVQVDDGNDGVVFEGAVTWLNNESLQVAGLEGNDTFHVIPVSNLEGPSPNSIPIFVDGGDPIGTTAGDRIVVFGNTNPVLFEPGPERDEGGFVFGFPERVSFDHIEAVTIVEAECVIVIGTNADDDITIIARDDSTHPGADGVQDFTAVVNDGIEVLYINVPELHVDALAGDDDIVLREPAPNLAVWDVDVFIAGGPPAARTVDQGDVFEMETPGTQTIIYSPNVPPGVGNATIEDVTNSTLIVIAPFVDACPPINFDSSPGGVEDIVYQGLAANDTLIINGTDQNDTITFHPAGAGSGTHTSGVAPDFSFTGATQLTVNGGAAGFDLVQVFGTEGPDAFTSTANTITLGGTLTIGTNMDRADLFALGGNDSVTLTLFSALPTVIDAGNGDDTVLGGTQSDLIFGGFGNDILIGGGSVDVIYGQDGNDTFGNPGTTPNGVNDDPGNDQFFGGDGSDTFVWEPGDGSDTIEGGAGESDVLIFQGSAGAETFNIFADTTTPTRAILFRSAGSIRMDMADIERIGLNTLGGIDTVVVGRENGTNILSDLSTTQVQAIDVNFGGADEALDNLFVEGRPLGENLLISVASGIVKVAGLDYDVRLLGASLADNDRLTVSGNEGNDDIKANAGVESAVNITLNGNDGNDFLSADAIINGGAGDDTLVGGAGADELHGDAGEDLLIGGGGVDTFDGGPDFDTILLAGSSGNDTFDVSQNAPSLLAADNYTFTHTIGLNGDLLPPTFVEFITKVNPALAPSDPNNDPTVEAIRIQAGKGLDLIRVQYADEYMDLNTANGVQTQTLRFEVYGDEPAAQGDRLIVNDAGPGDLTIIRYAADITEGRITMAPFLTSGEPSGMADIVFNGVERIDVTPQLDPINPTGGPPSGESNFAYGADGNGRVVIFHEDPYEFNDSRLTAGELARIGTSTNSPTIDPGGLTTPFPVTGDEDWYEFRPRETGTFQVKILFDRVTTNVGGQLANGRPGLPATGDLALEVFDAFGNLIVSGVHDISGPDAVPGNPARSNNRTAIFGATNEPNFPTPGASAQFNRIFIRVRGDDGARLSITPYDFDNIPGVGTGIPGTSDADIFGPQVTNVQITSAPGFNLFGLKPDGTTVPTPLTNSITISFRDLPPRAPGFLYPALDFNLTQDQLRGLFQVKGDKTGIIPIAQVILTNNPVVQGQVPTATVQLIFDIPLPDDRLTLTIDDSLTDPALNRLDGESNVSEPHNTPTFPSGDGKAGGDFVARFTVDSRPEIGGWAGTITSIDINGNGVWDPQAEGDFTNRDLQFKFGLASDHIFAGNFNLPGTGVNGGFVKIGAYGKQRGAFRFLLDFNGDGIPDANIRPSLKINGTPIAGNFAPANPGDEIGLFDGKTWYLDTNGNNNIDAGDRKIKGVLRGIPIVGDFDGDGVTDLATYQPDNNVFQFDLAASGLGNLDAALTFGFPGVRERPIAADMDQDGITDVGLYVPGNLTSVDNVVADWFFLITAGNPVYNRVPLTNDPNDNDVFSPTPLGNDIHYTMGNNFAIPLVGNFDPPVARTISPAPQLNLTRQTLASVMQSASVQLAGTGSSAGLVSRYTARGDMYWAGIVVKNDSFFVEIRRKLKGQWRTLKSKEVSTGVGTLTFVTRGQRLQVFLNGALVVSTTDRALARGFYGSLSTQGTRVTNLGVR